MLELWRMALCNQQSEFKQLEYNMSWLLHTVNRISKKIKLKQMKATTIVKSGRIKLA